MKIAIAQISPKFGQWKANLDKHEQYIELAIQNKVKLLLFPEMSLTGYALKDQTPSLAVTLQDEKLQYIAKCSQELDLVVGFPELIPGEGYAISSAYFHKGYLLHVHRKVYLPINGMFDDLKDFRRGESIKAFHAGSWKLGILICRDLWHMDAVQALALQKTHMILAPSAVPLRSIGAQGPNIHSFMERTVRSYSEHHTMYFAFANRVGFEEGICFYGGSMISDPFGRVIAQASFLEEELVTAEVNMSQIHRRIANLPLKHEENPSLLLSAYEEEVLP
ncbi:MAG TPA: nitrilase-related carbon-nitrogen hydrolase [Caldisericia bacterium]|nr:nitrilase-related carbon-nitrogen hydrolase [Caldisericia bacterium]